MEDIIIGKVKARVKDRLDGEGTGHDYFHVERVWRNALSIAKTESVGDPLIIELGALLHDIADHKFGHTDDDRRRIIIEMLADLPLNPTVIDQVVYIANNISYKGGSNRDIILSIEAKIVQDADRLDALGAIGIARTFAYGGHASRPIFRPFKAGGHDPNDSIAHFYNKLLKLKGLMNTETGKAMATVRHERLEAFLSDFFEEWG